MSRARDNANLGAQAGSGLTASDLTTGTLGNTVQDNITRVGTVGTGTWEGTTVAVNQGGTGATSLTDGGVLLGSGTSAVTATAVLADGEMLVGDGTTDPAIESGATLRTSIGLGNVTNESKATMFTAPTFTGTVAIPNVANLETAVVANTAKVTNSTNASDLASGTIADARMPNLTGAITTVEGYVATSITDDAVTGGKLANDIAISTTGAITTTGAFTSVGIDDNASGATSITIDSSENVGIKNTSPSSYYGGSTDLVIGNHTGEHGMTICS